MVALETNGKESRVTSIRTALSCQSCIGHQIARAGPLAVSERSRSSRTRDFQTPGSEECIAEEVHAPGPARRAPPQRRSRGEGARQAVEWRGRPVGRTHRRGSEETRVREAGDGAGDEHVMLVQRGLVDGDARVRDPRRVVDEEACREGGVDAWRPRRRISICGRPSSGSVGGGVRGRGSPSAPLRAADEVGSAG